MDCGKQNLFFRIDRQLNVFPQNFELPLLITVYAMVILGGAGSIPGVVVGAIFLMPCVLMLLPLKVQSLGLSAAWPGLNGMAK